MTEIIYRAKRPRRPGWVYGQVFRGPFLADQRLDHWYIAPEDGTPPVEIKEETIGQYTGMVDMNGNRIFGGDIVTYHHNVKRLVEVDDPTPREKYWADVKGEPPMSYRTVRIIKYKGTVSVDPFNGTKIELPYEFHWWKHLDGDKLDNVEIAGNIHTKMKKAEVE